MADRWWPARALGHWLAGLRPAADSELFYLFTAVWVIALTGSALAPLPTSAGAPLPRFPPAPGIPLPAPKSCGRPPAGVRPAGRRSCFAVLRVFQQDAKCPGPLRPRHRPLAANRNTVLIAGTDLVDRTIDPDDIFTFIDGRLGERFISQPADIARAAGGFRTAARRRGALPGQ